MSTVERKVISIPQWHSLAEAGIRLPMRIPIHGVSMFPLIRRDRDMVTILPLDAAPVPGDIVMFADPARSRYVLHRVWQLDGSRVQTWGDNCASPDGWLPLSQVWGKAILIERGRREIRPDPLKGIRLARLWHRVGRVYRWAMRR